MLESGAAVCHKGRLFVGMDPLLESPTRSNGLF